MTGGTASGKTTVARKIIESLDVPWVCILSMDSFYKVRSHRLTVLPWGFCTGQWGDVALVSNLAAAETC